VIVTGARQVGKTTLLRELFPTHRYVTLDYPAEAERAERSPEEFLRAYPPPVIIDEVQYAPSLFRHLKIAIDKDRDRKGQFFLTGSQKFVLMKGLSESLAGRAAIVELEGLSFSEFKDPLTEALESTGAASVLARGSFPELWANPLISPLEFFRSYIATYIERDVRQLLNITSLRDFERFMRACASRNGQVLNKSDIAKDVGISLKTVNEWLGVLDASNQITLLEPYFGNINKRLVKSPRLYFNDTGIVCFLLGLHGDAFTTYSGIGAIWEAAVFAELRKLREQGPLEASLWFYRDNEQREVDFIVSRGGGFTLLEVKWTELPTSSDIRSLKKVATLFPADEVRKQMVIARTRNTFLIEDGIEAVNGFRLKETELF